LEANPEEKESGAVHEEVSKEHATLKPVEDWENIIGANI
jgi:hypothetical protein